MAAHVSFIQLAVLFVILSSYDGDAYNVDVNAPIVKQGTKDSYFGFSTAFHRINSFDKKWVFRGVWIRLAGLVVKCKHAHWDDRCCLFFFTIWIGYANISCHIIYCNIKAVHWKQTWTLKCEVTSRRRLKIMLIWRCEAKLYNTIKI